MHPYYDAATTMLHWGDVFLSMLRGGRFTADTVWPQQLLPWFSGVSIRLVKKIQNKSLGLSKLSKQGFLLTLFHKDQICAWTLSSSIKVLLSLWLTFFSPLLRVLVDDSHSTGFLRTSLFSNEGFTGALWKVQNLEYLYRPTLINSTSWCGEFLGLHVSCLVLVFST